MRQITLLLTLTSCVLASPMTHAAASALHLASWNLEWLVSPHTARDSLNNCDDGKPAALPCDVARTQRRDSADHAALRAQARQLDADVIAFQEVENAATAAALFRGYRICITAAPGTQQSGFAVRAGLPHRCEVPLPLGRALHARPAAVLRLFPDSPDEVLLLGVHLKSGCHTRALPDTGNDDSACGILAGQVDALARWVDEHRHTDPPFALMGDVNRAGPAAADSFWLRLDPTGTLHNAAQHSAFVNCFTGQPFHQYIDHILLDSRLARRMIPGSFTKHGYPNAAVVRYRLSDHCPVSIVLRFTQFASR
jgi:endonuclease/exonuclease/phosphatase family metal-dependent hydrolase